MGGGDKSEDEHEDTSTIRELPKGYSAKHKSRSAKKIKIKPYHCGFKTKSKRSKAINKKLTTREIIKRYVKLRYGDLDKKTRDKKIRELYLFMLRAGIKSDQLVLEIQEIMKKR